MFPQIFPADQPVELEPGKTVTWRLVVRGNELYPYAVPRGGIRLLEREHNVQAIYNHATLGRIESNEVTHKIE